MNPTTLHFTLSTFNSPLSAAIEVAQLSATSLHVRWPVTIAYVDEGEEPLRSPRLLRGGSPSGASGQMQVVPDWLGGAFEWATNHCCEITMSGFSFAWACLGDCGCGGCEAHGWYVYEGYRLDAFGGHCGCMPAEPEAPPRIEVSASPSVVFFEKGTANWHTSDVSCSYRTDGAGTFTLTYSGDSCVVRDSTLQTVSSGFTWNVDEACEGDMHFTVWSPTRSSSPSGTEFSFEFTPDGNGTSLEDETSVVFVEYETKTTATWPNDRTRKTIGVLESVNITMDPVVSDFLSASSPDSVLRRKGGGTWMYKAPDRPVTDEIYAPGLGGLFAFQVLAPTGYDARLKKIVISTNSVSGTAGGYRMYFDLTVMPTNVSFYAIQIRESVMTATNFVGYFAEPRNANFLTHSPSAGAGVWSFVYRGNKCSDEAQMAELPPPWGSGGSITWPIPNEYTDNPSNQSGVIFCDTDQEFSVGASGTSRLCKFGWFAEVSTNRVPTCGRRTSQ